MFFNFHYSFCNFIFITLYHSATQLILTNSSLHLTGSFSPRDPLPLSPHSPLVTSCFRWKFISRSNSKLLHRGATQTDNPGEDATVENQTSHRHPLLSHLPHHQINRFSLLTSKFRVTASFPFSLDRTQMASPSHSYTNTLWVRGKAHTPTQSPTMSEKFSPSPQIEFDMDVKFTQEFSRARNGRVVCFSGNGGVIDCGMVLKLLSNINNSLSTNFWGFLITFFLIWIKKK